MNYLNSLLLVERKIKTGAKMKSGRGVKVSSRIETCKRAQDINVKKLLLLVKAFGVALASSSLIKLTNKRF